jgi:hypothetical protein
MARRPGRSVRPLRRRMDADPRQPRDGRGVDVHHADGGRLHGGRDPGRRDPQEAAAKAGRLPLVRLEDTTFRTRYGVKNRPHFAIVDWVFPGGARESAPAPEPARPAIAAVPPAPAAATPPIPRGKATITSGKPKLKAETASGVNPIDDDIPFDL